MELEMCDISITPARAMTIPWLDRISANAWVVFVAYGGLHLVTVCICALVVVGLAAAGRRLGDRHEGALRRVLGIFGVVYWISYNIWWNRNGLNLTAGLPLHICDLNGLVAPLALLTLNRWLRATLYFWTFALTIQAFVQPNLVHGPSTAVFWLFWVQHTIILAYAVYDLAVLAFRPGWRDLGRVYLVSAIYVVIIIPVNLLLGANYGFIGSPPPPDKIPPFVDALGPWPQRALLMVALAAAAFALLTLPWQRSAARKTV
jgi:hypothetical integral membrane protein (TIGR02206 family)